MFTLLAGHPSMLNDDKVKSLLNHDNMSDYHASAAAATNHSRGASNSKGDDTRPHQYVGTHLNGLKETRKADAYADAYPLSKADAYPLKRLAHPTTHPTFLALEHGPWHGNYRVTVPTAEPNAIVYHDTMKYTRQVMWRMS